MGSHRKQHHSKKKKSHSAVDEQSVMGLVIFWTLCLSLLLTLNGGESFYFSNKGNSFRNQGVSLRRTELTPLQLLTPCERAVWNCCQTNRANYVLPVFLFRTKWMSRTSMVGSSSMCTTNDI